MILGSIVVGSAGVENKIKGVPDNRLALSFLAHRLVLPDCFHPAISGGLATPGLEHYRF